MKPSRRTFLEFLGKGAVGLALTNTIPRPGKMKLSGIRPSNQDDLILAKGLNYHVIAKWEDPIGNGHHFGFNNDYTAFIPSTEIGTEGLLWVNHEYIDPLFVSKYSAQQEKTRDQVDTERYHVGGSILKVQQGKKGKWKITEGEENRRITGATEIPFNWNEPIAGSETAIGTLANCSGGITPWGTILTCEENYDMFYGEIDRKTNERKVSRYDLGWWKQYDHPPEHYGWVVEVNPQTGEAQKHVALGRCAHECATMIQLEDGRVVVYTGDDAHDQCLYKYVSNEPGNLRDGRLYVANTLMGKWTPLIYEESKVLQKFFDSQTEVLIHIREAARLVGGTPLDRPEDIEIDPISGHVLVSLTNSVPRGNYFGSILKIIEDNHQHDALTFSSETFLAGGEETGFACPDNMAFDIAGNLWFTSDISGSAMNKEPYKAFKNNGLFVVPRNGLKAGEVIQMASAPIDAETNRSIL